MSETLTFDLSTFTFPPFPTNHLFPAANLCELQPHEAIHSTVRIVYWLHILWVFKLPKRNKWINLNKSLKIPLMIVVKEQAPIYGSGASFQGASCSPPTSALWSLGCHIHAPNLLQQPTNQASTSQTLPSACSAIQTKANHCTGTEMSVSVHNSNSC